MLERSEFLRYRRKPLTRLPGNRPEQFKNCQLVRDFCTEELRVQLVGALQACREEVGAMHLKLRSFHTEPLQVSGIYFRSWEATDVVSICHLQTAIVASVQSLVSGFLQWLTAEVLVWSLFCDTSLADICQDVESLSLVKLPLSGTSV